MPKYARTVRLDAKTKTIDRNRIRDYWLEGGADKWVTFTELRDHLLGIPLEPDFANRLAATIYHLRYGVWPGDHHHGDHKNKEVAVGDTQPGLDAATNVGEQVATAATGTRTAVRETVQGAATSTGPTRMRVALIRSGWSLNNSYYPAAVLARDGAKAWPKGTQCFVDHDTDVEEEARPAGSIRNLGGVLTTDAAWNPATQCLEADVRLFQPWAPILADMAESIGMSIRAWVYADQGEAEGRQGVVVNSIAEGRSVDFVTVPAAGGAILSVLESVGNRAVLREARNVGHWFESRIHSGFTEVADHMFGDGWLTRDERITLSGAVGDALGAFAKRLETDAPQLYKRDPYDEPTMPMAGHTAEAAYSEWSAHLGAAIADKYGEQGYTWVRDFDPDKGLVWFDVCPDGESSSTFQQTFTYTDNGVLTLTGDPVEVVARTVFDPVPDTEPDDDIDDPGMPSDSGDMPGMEAAPAPVPPAAIAVTETVTPGDPPAVTNPSTEEGSAVAEVQTGAPPAPAATAPAATAPTDATATATLEALQALTRQVTALTEANTALTERANRRDAEDRTRRNRDTAREAVTAALAAPEVPQDLREQIGPRVTAAVLADISTTEAGDVDTVALGESITAAITAESGYVARLLESAGVGRPRGLGSQPATEAQTAEQFEKQMTESFIALGLTPAAAAVAAKGRG